MKNLIKNYCQKLNIDWCFIKFIFVGCLNTLFGYGVFAICNFMGFHYTLSTLTATILGVLFNFVENEKIHLRALKAIKKHLNYKN